MGAHEENSCQSCDPVTTTLTDTSPKLSTVTMKLILASIFLLPLSLAATPQQRLVQLANAGNGIIKLDAGTFDVLLDPKRTWSASVQLTALDRKRGCHPCKSVYYPSLHSLIFTS